MVSAASSRYWSCAVSAAVFVERGYAAAAMETIAARAQASVSTLYGTFGGKRQILSALILGLKDEGQRRRAQWTVTDRVSYFWCGQHVIHDPGADWSGWLAAQWDQLIAPDGAVPLAIAA